MRYLDNKKVALQLHEETRREMRKMENVVLESLRNAWAETKKHMKASIALHVVNDFGNGPMNKPEALRRGTLFRIEKDVQRLIDLMKAHFLPSVDNALREARFQEMLRTVWIMRQTLPPAVKVHLPLGFGAVASVTRESARERLDLVIREGKNRKSDMSFSTHFSSWTDAYKSALVHNIALGSINGATVQDATDEVDATKVGSPSNHMEAVLDRLFLTMFAANTFGVGGGHDDAMDANPDAPVNEIWQARADSSVCDDCAAMDGVKRSETDLDVTLHPSCRCAWVVDPAAWADVGGDSVEGQPSTAMVFRDEDGNPVGGAVVQFNDWITPNLEKIKAARKAAGLM